MPHICPRPCSRLATAAVFISVGVVQFVVGIILLRSKYVYLLAGPDFWTAFINITVGCLLGVTASVWKQSRKRQSKKHIIRRNFVIALLFSGMLINITTLGMLILGEGNTLMSIRLESNGRYTNQTFVGEILAYAYATSVCSPIVCIVVAIVAIAGNCFELASRKNSVDMKVSLNGLKKDRSQSLQWVYTPDLLGLTKKNSENFLTSSSESDDETSDDAPTYKRNANSAEELQSVFHRMAQGKRDSILSDSAVMLRQLEVRRKNKHYPLIQDGSYVEPISQMEKPVLSDKKRIGDDLIDHDRLLARSGKFRKGLQDGNTRLSSSDIALKPLTHLRTNQHNVPYRSSYYSDEDLGKYQNASSQLAAKNFSSLKRDLKQKLQTGPKINMLHCRSDDDRNPLIRHAAAVRKKSEGRPEQEADLNDFIADQTRFKRKYELSRHHSGENMSSTELAHSEVLSPELSDCFSPDEFGGDLFDAPRRSSWAGEIIPINVNKSPFARLSQKLIPVPSPVVPNNQEIVTAIIESKYTGDQNQNTPEENASMSSFRETMKIANKENSLEYPKVGSQNVKKHDFSRMSMMASISEEPNSEMHQSVEEAGGYSVPQETGATPKAPKGHLNKKSLISAYSESSKEMSQDGESLQSDKTPNRKMNASCKTLRRLWSSVGSEKDVDFLEQVVDEDSLIGLSEEELIARQFRNRSIRKALQQRIKNEIII